MVFSEAWPDMDWCGTEALVTMTARRHSDRGLFRGGARSAQEAARGAEQSGIA